MEDRDFVEAADSNTGCTQKVIVWLKG